MGSHTTNLIAKGIAEMQHGEGAIITPEQKVKLDELHKRKIDLADEVLILNVEGYIGKSTNSEIQYADLIGVPVTYLVKEPPNEH